MSFQDLYQRCRAEFLVNSDLTLKAQVKIKRVGGSKKERTFLSLFNGSVLDKVKFLTFKVKQVEVL